MLIATLLAFIAVVILGVVGTGLLSVLWGE